MATLVVPRRFVFTGNPYYPLPPDYPSLSPKGKKAARINALCLQETPEDLVYAWALFRKLYLQPLPEGQFYKRRKESPAFHYQAIRDVGRHQFNAIAAPRGSAKSTVLGKELPLLLTLTRPNWTTLLLLSKMGMCTQRMFGEPSALGLQLTQNKLIFDDFGNMKPKKGAGTWSAGNLVTTIGSSLLALPVKGGSLGQRPDLILCDDPEMDPVLQQVTADLTENFERFLFNIIMPMLDAGESALYWIGTLLSKQCFLYYVTTTTSDPRFRFWNRRLLDAEDDGKGNLLWEEKWDQATLEEERKSLGLDAYNAQRRNRPGDRERTVLLLHPQGNQYEVLGEQPTKSANPLNCDSTLLTYTRKGVDVQGDPIFEKVEREWAPTVKSMYRVVLMDWAKCMSNASDYIAMTVIGLENTEEYPNTWYVLDMLLSNKLPNNTWVPQLWSLASRWDARYIGIEASGAQSTLIQTAQDYAADVAYGGWLPMVVPIKYPPHLSKEDRISALTPRFNSSRIKYPAHLKSQWPFIELYHQTVGFTGAPGGTQYDDAIDTIAMAPYLVGASGKVAPAPLADSTSSYNPINKLASGEIIDEMGNPMAGAYSVQEWPVDVALKQIFDKVQNNNPDRIEYRQQRVQF